MENKNTWNEGRKQNLKNQIVMLLLVVVVVMVVVVVVQQHTHPRLGLERNDTSRTQTYRHTKQNEWNG
jgi:cell division protein FtsL